MSEGKQLSKTNKHLIKQKIKLELLLTCTPRLGVLTPLSRKGQTPSNVDPEGKMNMSVSHLSVMRRSYTGTQPKIDKPSSWRALVLILSYQGTLVSNIRQSLLP
ncbi:hypothetical protein J6590_066805 [Homalodisca vitripennis]|nr:hypothetical protein J6590_066805 [Homalodisca vitripennis]